MNVILMIEDDLSNARLAERILTRAGYEVVIAANGEEGLGKVMDARPALILVDLGLPDIDGQTVIAVIRQQAALKSVPILAFTAYPPDAAEAMARAYGCDGVISKPIDTRTFADQVGAYLPAPAQPLV
jgi:CheY-like chemotaxis protein